MGIGFVLFFWAIAGTILAGIGTLTFGGATALLTRRVKEGRKRVILVASLFPFACLAWAGIVFVFQAIVNETLLHRDAGLGDDWHCPLPNGYSLLMIDVPDLGTVYNPKTQKISSGVSEQEDTAFGIRNVQVAGQYILGASDTNSFEHFGRNSVEVNSYFLLNTQTGQRRMFSSSNELSAAVQRFGIQMNLEPVNAVYSKYRFTWFDVLVGFLFFLPLIVTACLIVRWIVRLRKTSGVSAHALVTT